MHDDSDCYRLIIGWMDECRSLSSYLMRTSSESDRRKKEGKEKNTRRKKRKITQTHTAGRTDLCFFLTTF